MEPGRNQPCPCDSGKKYKKCCGAAELIFGGKRVPTLNDIDNLNLNRAIAYAGDVGARRKKFCSIFIARKQAYLKRIEQDQLEQTVARREKITCHKGCINCCMQYLIGTLQECEAIVYYLYQHDRFLADFMYNYPAWQYKVSRPESGYTALKNAIEQRIRCGVAESYIRAYEQANFKFMMMSPVCPFHNREHGCLIYEVRPWTCATQVATTPNEWCHPTTNARNEKPKMYMSEMVPEEMPYFRETAGLNVMLVPVGVWQILTLGYCWLSSVPGLEGLDQEILQDPEVLKVVGRFMENCSR